MTRKALDRLPERGPVAADPASHAAPRPVALREPPAREGGPSLSPDNVIRLVPARRGAQYAPAIAPDPSLRIGPASRLPSRRALFFSLSLAAHAALYVPFHRVPQPMASIGVEAISVEIVLGATDEAGQKPDRGTAAISAPPPVAPAIAQQGPRVPEAPAPPVAADPPAEIAAVQPAEAREAAAPSSGQAAEPAALAPPVATAEPPIVAAQTEAAATEPPPAHTDRASVTAPPPPKSVASPPPKPSPASLRQRVREQRREPSRAAKRKAAHPTAREAASTAPASRAAGGVGHGRSDPDTNYRGLVAAHLARHKRFPPEALGRGDHGRAVVSFSLDGTGRVTSARLVSGTGVPSLDGESVAMVRRASPFPAPPHGRPMSFTVPINFQLR